MKISQLDVNNFRNLSTVSIRPGHQTNILYGQNGSGKTSLLEAIHYLGLARSFRTRLNSRLINHDSDSFIAFCQLFQPNIGMLPIGIERSSQQVTIKIAGNPATSIAELAALLPLQLLNTQSHLLLSSGSLPRRQFLDWGVFHVEQQFFNHWQRLKRILKQRNAALKFAKNYKDIQSWDEEFTICANWLHLQRLNYFTLLKPVYADLLQILLGENPYQLQYRPGWDVNDNLIDILQASFARDQQFGRTHLGPHRADLNLLYRHVPAAEVMSQGQQKLAVYALRLAQGKLLKTLTQKLCIYLIDDLPSELDEEKRQLVSEQLLALDAQVFVSCIDPESLPYLLAQKNTRMFHVEHGKVVMVA